ncbi:hypothetical protein GYMLUDRAFT_43769 [Collybiopsis luxurians FD-317 M1]|uniref:Uncharacterized protein n=1 Tax=Collybiopsis luxurians FD-317 M1 TaxID=944289 RepID=A0A0D0CNT5_9AGAR|nr:hypothetical protein GYMLUDRAFT_43769 [Collybiopsis luxurians FD-317 M1]
MFSWCCRAFVLFVLSLVVFFFHYSAFKIHICYFQSYNHGSLNSPSLFYLFLSFLWLFSSSRKGRRFFTLFGFQLL